MFLEDCITYRQIRNYAKIPDNTDVLITHTPAFGILDFDDNINYGSEELREKKSALKLKAHLFGHIHAQHGLEIIGDTLFPNGATLHADYTSALHPNMITI